MTGVARAASSIALVVAVIAAAPAAAQTSSTWRPNFRIGPVQFNYPLPSNVEVLRRGPSGGFAVRPRGGGGIIRGFVFEDPNSGRDGARAIWTRSRLFSYRGVRVGLHWRTARRRLGRGWEVRSGRGCGWLNSHSLRRDRTGPVSTQLFFSRRTGRIFAIELNEITEIGCPR
jgi:hypothetical protein